jgi:anti-sigma B factor antagonist
LEPRLENAVRYPAQIAIPLTITQNQDRLVIKLGGVLDDGELVELRRATPEILNEPFRLIVLDVSDVSFIDSEGFGALLNIQKQLTESDKSMALAGCREAVRLALSLTRLEVLFRCYPDVQSVPAR